MPKHSERARRNTRNGIDLRISVIKDRIEGLEKEKKDYNRFLGRGLNDKWIKKLISSIDRKLKARRTVLKRYEARRARWKREGKI